MAQVKLVNGPKGNSRRKWLKDGAQQLVSELEVALSEYQYMFILKAIEGIRGTSVSKGVDVREIDVKQDRLHVQSQLGSNRSRWRYILWCKHVRAKEIKIILEKYFNPEPIALESVQELDAQFDQVVVSTEPTSDVAVLLAVLGQDASKYSQAEKVVREYSGRDLEQELLSTSDQLVQVRQRAQELQQKKELLLLESEDLLEAEGVLRSERHQLSADKIEQIKGILVQK